MINLRLFRLVFFLLNYGKWKLLGLKSKKFINIYPNVNIINPQNISRGTVSFFLPSDVQIPVPVFRILQ